MQEPQTLHITVEPPLTARVIFWVIGYGVGGRLWMSQVQRQVKEQAACLIDSSRTEWWLVRTGTVVPAHAHCHPVRSSVSVVVRKS